MLLALLAAGALALLPVVAPPLPTPTATIPPDALRGCSAGLPGCR
ncbi:MAG TPA: hypothetical protein VFA49_15710 [Chloroflexota bacterium]|nr:hypothetical protein [Chloroflexota bacterium]